MLATGENQQHLGSKEASSAVYMKTNAVRSQSRLASVGAYKLQTSMTKLSEINTAKVMIHSAHSRSGFTCPVIDPKLVKSSYFVHQCLSQQDVYRKLLSLFQTTASDQ